MEVYRQFGGVLLVLGTLVFLLYMAQRRGWAQWSGLRNTGNQRTVTVLERIRLTPQHTLHVLAIGERRLLVTSSPGSCQLIAELPKEDSSGLPLGKAS